MMLTCLIAAAAVPIEPLAAKELEPLAFLVGHCWRGEVGPGFVDTHCFEAVYGGQHVRDSHSVWGGGDTVTYQGETLYSWNTTTKHVEYTYWNSDGEVSHGNMVPGANLLDFSETFANTDGRTEVISTKWRRNGANAYDVVGDQNRIIHRPVVTYHRAD